MKIIWDQNIDGGAGQSTVEEPAEIKLEEETLEEDIEELPPSRWFGANYR
jgi:hypothetical protein